MAQAKTDSEHVEAWSTGFYAWSEVAKSMFPEGKAKEAFSSYPWFQTTDNPFVRLSKPASETRFGLVTTGGYSIDGEQKPMRGYPSFDERVPEIRRIPANVDRSKLVINHPGYDHKYAKEDINANLPFDRLNELVADGTIGALAPETLVLMGLQPNVGPLINETIPEIVAAFKADDVEAALLVPS